MAAAGSARPALAGAELGQADAMFEHEAGCGVVTGPIRQRANGSGGFGFASSRALHLAVRILLSGSKSDRREPRGQTGAGQYRALPGVLGKGIASRTFDRPVT
jgi:hypothetical protein